MEIIIHIESKKLDKNLKSAVDEYVKRTSPYCRVDIRLIKAIDNLKLKPSSKVYRVVPGSNSPTSTGLAKLIECLNIQGVSCIEFIISDSKSYYDNSTVVPSSTADIEEFNLSSFSMSKDLTTVVLTEQLYRAYTIMNNITYHK